MPTIATKSVIYSFSNVKINEFSCLFFLTREYTAKNGTLIKSVNFLPYKNTERGKERDSFLHSCTSKRRLSLAMKTTRYGGVSAYVATATATAIILTTVVIVLIISFSAVFSCFLSSTDSKPEFVIPIVQLQSQINLTHQHSDEYKFRAVISPDHYRSSTSFPLILNRNRTFIVSTIFF